MSFFTVVIPTRNRPELLKTALQSVLEQDFEDFEVIVSDNSDAEDAVATRDVAEQVLRDARFRYVRPPAVLSMVDHWEWATRHAEGEFTGVLTDRMSYRLYTLRRCFEALGKSGLDIVSFKGERLLNDSPPYRFLRERNFPRISVTQSETLLAECASCRFPRSLPRMLNSFSRTTLLHRMAEQYGSIYTGVAPDYSFAFRALDMVESIVSLDDRLLVSGGESRSNGLAWLANKPNNDSRDFLARSDLGRWLRYAPIPHMVPINNNSLALEYEIARESQRSGRLPPLDKGAFYRETRRELRKLIKVGHDLASASEALERYRIDNRIKPGVGLTAALRRFRHRAASKWRARRSGAGYTPTPPGFPTVIELLRWDARQDRGGNGVLTPLPRRIVPSK